MGNSSGVDGRINYIDTEELKKLILKLREQVIKEVALSRFHFELSMDAEKKLKKAKDCLSEELRKTILKQIMESRRHYQYAISADRRLKRAEDRLSELRFQPKRMDYL